MNYIKETHAATSIGIKGFPWLVCKHCGLIYLKNQFTAWCIKMGCNNEDNKAHDAFTRAGGMRMKPIPISAARKIAESYGYDQVIIIARKVGEDPQPHGEHCTTYGVDRKHCDVAARIGDFLKFKVMGWTKARAGNAKPMEPEEVE